MPSFRSTWIPFFEASKNLPIRSSRIGGIRMSLTKMLAQCRVSLAAIGFTHLIGNWIRSLRMGSTLALLALFPEKRWRTNQTPSKPLNQSGSVSGAKRFGSILACENGLMCRPTPEAGARPYTSDAYLAFVEKSSELPKSDPRRKFKYRVVFQGNNVVTQNWGAAMFQDTGSNPSNMQSAADCYGCMPGYVAEQADAE